MPAPIGNTLSRQLRRRSRLLVPATLLAVAGAAAPASAQWTVVNLHPAGAKSSEARGVENGQQVGVANYGPGNGFEYGAILWTGSAASAVVLDPTPSEDGFAECVHGGVQFGVAEVFDPTDGLYRYHAAMWNGTAGSFVDLHPPEIGASNSRVLAAADGVQGGLWNPVSGGGGGGLELGFGRPCIWHGTAESFVDLTPLAVETANVLGVFGNQQVGAHYDFGFANACMWNGTPESYVDLNPVGAFASVAECTDGVHQYGGSLFVDFSTGAASFQAGYWSGSFDSWVDMTPAGAPGASINAVDGSQQVGVTFGDPVGGPPLRAALWNGSAGSYVDLHALVPAGYSQSQANDIWHDANGAAFIVGFAVNDATGENEAIMWVPARPGVDLITDVQAPRNCTAAPGKPMDYLVRVDNGGLDASGPVTVTFNLPDAGLATFASANPAPTSATPTTLTFDIAPIAGGSAAEITVTLTAVAAESDVSVSASASTAGDYDTGNNGDAASNTTLPLVPASEHIESSDAPELTAQPVPAGPLTAIEGRLESDADLYQIRVDNWAAFSATTLNSAWIASCNGAPDALGFSNLFLFDADGNGIAFYKGDTLSTISGAEFDLTNRVNGEIVWLGISQYSYLPTSGGEGSYIWSLDPTEVTRTPDGPGAFGAVDGWEFADNSGAGNFFYRIDLTGASGVPTTPACPADLDNSGNVDVFDLLAYLDLWFTSDAAAELTGDSPASIDVFDLLAYLDGWFAGC